MGVKDGLAVGCNVDGRRPVGSSEGCIVGNPVVVGVELGKGLEGAAVGALLGGAMQGPQ